MKADDNRLRVPVSESDHRRGPDDAPLTLVEYGDYECPFCAQANGFLRQLKAELGNDLRLVYRNFPLTNLHPLALGAARIAEAAAGQGKFWEMHDLLFENQEALEPEHLVDYAKELDLNLIELATDVKNPETEERISQDLYGGARSGVNGTPTFFLNGYKYEGDYSIESLRDALTGMKRAS